MIPSRAIVILPAPTPAKVVFSRPNALAPLGGFVGTMFSTPAMTVIRSRTLLPTSGNSLTFCSASTCPTVAPEVARISWPETLTSI